MNLNVGNYPFGIRQPVKADKKAKVDDELANQDGTLPKKGATIDPDDVPDSMKGLTGSEILASYNKGQLANVDGSLPKTGGTQETNDGNEGYNPNDYHESKNGKIYHIRVVGGKVFITEATQDPLTGEAKDTGKTTVIDLTELTNKDAGDAREQEIFSLIP